MIRWTRAAMWMVLGLCWLGCPERGPDPSGGPPAEPTPMGLTSGGTAGAAEIAFEVPVQRDPAPSVRRGQEVTWHIRNDTNETFEVTIQNFASLDEPSATGSPAAAADSAAAAGDEAAAMRAPGGTTRTAAAIETSVLFVAPPTGSIPPGGGTLTSRVRGDAPLGRYSYAIAWQGSDGTSGIHPNTNTPEMDIRP
jgi:hypothetical protein